MVESSLKHDAFWNTVCADYQEDRQGLKPLAETIFQSRLGKFSLLFMKRPENGDNDVWWLLHRGDECVGVGLLYVDDRSITTSISALHSVVRGNGLYAFLLATFCRSFRMPVYSDWTRTDAAEGAWIKAGADFVKCSDGDGLYRLLPGKLNPLHIVG